MRCGLTHGSSGLASFGCGGPSLDSRPAAAKWSEPLNLNVRPNVSTTFRATTFSDIFRDGLGIEVAPVGGAAVAEVFRSDADHGLTLTIFDDGAPVHVVEMLVKRAWIELDPFEDGTPLIAARTNMSNPTL